MNSRVGARRRRRDVAAPASFFRTSSSMKLCRGDVGEHLRRRRRSGSGEATRAAATRLRVPDGDRRLAVAGDRDLAVLVDAGDQVLAAGELGPARHVLGCGRRSTRPARRTCSVSFGFSTAAGGKTSRRSMRGSSCVGPGAPAAIQSARSAILRRVDLELAGRRRGAPRSVGLSSIRLWAGSAGRRAGPAPAGSGRSGRSAGS